MAIFIREGISSTFNIIITLPLATATPQHNLQYNIKFPYACMYNLMHSTASDERV